MIFAGVGVALVTAFDERGAVDSSASADLAATLVDNGVSAVVVAGTTGEASRLSSAERVDLLRAVHAGVGDRVPVIAGTGASTGEEAARLTRDAMENGADGVLVLSPPGADGETLRRYYDTVVRVSSVPVLAYHFPRVSPPGIPVETLAELPIAGVKDSTADADRLAQTLGLDPAVPVYVGSAVLVSLAGLLGAAGAILALANVAPEACVRAFAGDGDAQRHLVEIHRKVRKDGLVALKRHVSERFGTPSGVRD